MRALIATAMYPTPERPAFGTFVRTQVESLRQIGVQAEPFVLQGSNRKLMYPRAVPALRRRLDRTPSVDVVHAHYGLVGAVARLQRRVPVVLTFHGDDLLGTIDEAGRTIPWSRLIAGGGRLLARTVDAVIVQSEQMAERVHAVREVHVIPHEVDMELFRPVDRALARARLGLDPDGHYVLFAASPSVPVKRFPLARDAVEFVRRDLPGAELLVVHQETQERLVQYMNACDVLAFTSFQEGSPNIVKQAMACNLPVVATDVGDVREIVSGTRGCTIVEPDVATVAEGLLRALRAGERSDGRERVQHLRPQAVARRVLRVYERVTGFVSVSDIVQEV